MSSCFTSCLTYFALGSGPLFASRPLRIHQLNTLNIDALPLRFALFRLVLRVALTLALALRLFIAYPFVPSFPYLRLRVRHAFFAARLRAFLVSFFAMLLDLLTRYWMINERGAALQPTPLGACG